MVAAIFVIPEDAVKLLLMVVIGGGLLGLGRWSSRLGGPSVGDSPADAPTPDQFDSAPDSGPKVWPPSAEEVAASLPFDPSLGKIQIKKLYFDKADVSPGPENSEIFADDLHIQLYDPDSNRYWWQSYFVATPKGLDKVLREKSWNYLYAPEMLVIPRYDLEEIRRAVVSRIIADYEHFKDREQAKEESL